MPLFKFRPEVTREAIEWRGSNLEEIKEFLQCPFLEKDSISGSIFLDRGFKREEVKPGYHIVKGFDEKPYAVAPSLFKKIYVPIDEKKPQEEECGAIGVRCAE